MNQARLEKTMRVVVNQLAALGRRTGIGHYTAELLRCLGETEQAHTLSRTAADLAREVYEGNNVVPYLFDNNLAIILRAEGDLDRARLLEAALPWKESNQRSAWLG